MLHKMLAKGMITVCCVCLMQTSTNAQTGQVPITDTMQLTITQAEKRFLNKNLTLLAEHYNVQSSQALVTQARKWDNPVLNTDQNLYTNGKWFQHTTVYDAAGNATPVGEYFVQVQQLIKTAGKRGKEINLAKANVNISEWQFKNTMRNLRAALFQDYYTIAQLQDNDRLYKEEEQKLSRLLIGLKAELNAGNIALKEYLRVKALMVNLQQTIIDNSNSLGDNEAELKTMLQVTGNIFIKPKISDEEQTEMPNLTLNQLIDTAKQYNPDYQQETYQMRYQKVNLSLQKALAIPDLTVGTEFDQSANYTPNYYGLAISLPLPLWNRNQGNIKSARYQMKQEEANMQLADIKLQNDVTNAYQKLLNAIQLNSLSNRDFDKDYNTLYNNIVKSYQNRQISLIEFLDYFNDYADTRQKQLQQLLNLRLAKEQLNDIVGTEVIK